MCLNDRRISISFFIRTFIRVPIDISVYEFLRTICQSSVVVDVFLRFFFCWYSAAVAAVSNHVYVFYPRFAVNILRFHSWKIITCVHLPLGSPLNCVLNSYHKIFECLQMNGAIQEWVSISKLGIILFNQEHDNDILDVIKYIIDIKKGFLFRSHFIWMHIYRLSFSFGFSLWFVSVWWSILFLDVDLRAYANVCVKKKKLFRFTEMGNA